MKKYSNYLKTELIEVIKQKNETISKLNGKVYYYKKTAEYYKKNIRSKKMILDVEMPSYNLRVNEQMDLGEVFLKAQAIEKNLSLLIDDDLKPSDIERITLDLNEQIDEFGLLTYDGDYANRIEVLTKEQAEENDRDFVNEENGYSKDDVDSYEVGGCLSVYKKLGESDYYYREM